MGLKDIESSDTVEDVVVIVLLNTPFLGGFIPQFFSAFGILQHLPALKAFVPSHRGLLRCAEYESDSSSCLMGLPCK